MARWAFPAGSRPQQQQRYTTRFPVLLLTLILLLLLFRQFYLTHNTPPPAARHAIRHNTAKHAADLATVAGFQHIPKPWRAIGRAPRGGFRFPKIILQTVRNKSSIPCETLTHITSWSKRNPGYKHMLFDDADITAFMAKYHPQWQATFASLRSPVERADMWRYLALFTYGGVYADSDVRCMKPIDEWNAENRHDAKVLVGLEGVEEKWHRGSQFQQWTIAAMPDHELLGAMPRYIAAYMLQHPYTPPTRANANTQVLERTGPIRWTDAVLDYLIRFDVVPPTDAMVVGVKAADIRIMPVENMALGWGETCDEIAAKTTKAYLCHQYHGSWKTGYYYGKKLNLGCPTPPALLEPLQV